MAIQARVAGTLLLQFMYSGSSPCAPHRMGHKLGDSSQDQNGCGFRNDLCDAEITRGLSCHVVGVSPCCVGNRGSAAGWPCARPHCAGTANGFRRRVRGVLGDVEGSAYRGGEASGRGCQGVVVPFLSMLRVIAAVLVVTLVICSPSRSGNPRSRVMSTGFRPRSWWRAAEAVRMERTQTLHRSG